MSHLQRLASVILFPYQLAQVIPGRALAPAEWSAALRRYNVLTGAAWDKTVSTTDTPSYATRLGVQTATLLINVQELCDLSA